MFDKEIIREIQLAELKMLQKFDELCTKHDIAYWVDGGTLLGAVRHEGFIPWDDDLDVRMMRADFEKLAKLNKDEWGDEFELITPEMDDIKHDEIFPRVYIKNSVVQSVDDVENWQNPNTYESWSTSLMLDIFVCDYTPFDEKKRMALKNKANNMKKMYKRLKLLSNNKGKSGKRFLVDSIYRYSGVVLRKLTDRPWRKVCHKLDRERKKVSDGNIETLYWYPDCPMKYEDIFPLKQLKFENINVPVPNDYDKILTGYYGDYMDLPKEENRYHINLTYVDLGDGRIFAINPIKGSMGYEG